ncbi:hypothetical protein MMC25_001570 [Agyrium rufum]|nr:hypothetical protein [Agyrium rufum]
MVASEQQAHEVDVEGAGTYGNYIHGQYESLVPLLMYHNKLDPQAAMDRASEMVHESYNSFNKAEQALYEEVEPEQLENVKAYVLACKDLIMCNLHWSYGLKRYMEKDMLQKDGSVIFNIRLPSGR